MRANYQCSIKFHPLEAEIEFISVPHYKYTMSDDSTGNQRPAVQAPKKDLAGLAKVVGIFKDSELFDEVEAFVEKVRTEDSQQKQEPVPTK